MAKSSTAKRRKQEVYTAVDLTAKGVRITWPKTDFLSPL